MRTDHQLAWRLRRGEPGAFEELLDAYGDRVFRLVRRYVSNASDAEDVTQEVFVAIYRSIGTFRGDAALHTWLYRVTVNHCFKHARRPAPPTVPLDEDLDRAAESHSDPLQAAVTGELGADVTRAIDRLPDHHRDVVLLHELHGLTYQECAAALGVPVGTVKSRLSNAFRRLRQHLAAYAPMEAAPHTPGSVRV